MRRRLALAALLAAACLGGAVAAGPDDGAWERYLERSAVLKQYRDKGELDEAGVIKVLREEGVLQLSSQSGLSSFASGFRPFKVRVYGGLWRWPLHAGVVSSEFGRRWGRHHDGIDIAADAGDLVYAAAPGTVIYAGHGLRGYGNVVIVRHDDKTTTLYAHNSSLRVRKGMHVDGGELVATVGATGHATGPHVHFEVRKENRPLNPRRVLPRTRF